MIPTSGQSTEVSLLSGILGGATQNQNFNLGSGISSEESLAILKSRRFSEIFINKEDLMKDLFSESWNQEDESWTSDEDPTLSDGYNLIQDSLSISLDKSIIELEFEYKSKDKVAFILNRLIYRVNEHIRNNSIIDSKKNISFLEMEIKKTSLSGSRDMLYRLVEKQMQKIMIANTNEEFAFKIVDPAVEPIHPAGPNRKVIVIIISFIGFVISLIIAFIRNFFSNARDL